MHVAKIMLALAAAALAVPASAQMRITTPAIPSLRDAMTAGVKRTNFRPAEHGFKFANTFANNMLPFDIRTDGLCGGMVYAALDYFHARKPIPQQNYEPTEGTRLREYIQRRQLLTLAGNADKWAEVTINPLGARNEEFYNWGIDGKPGGRIDELRREIDAGRPVPLGLRSCDEGCTGDHQVLAIGYDMGGYKGDLGANAANFKIFVYDPNRPGEVVTLMPWPEQRQFRYLEPDSRGKRHSWRTYFVDRKYRAQMPPEVALAANELLLDIATGGDDLRGGEDNLNIKLLLRDGTELPFPAINNRRRWVNNSSQTVAVTLPSGLAPGDIRGIRLETTFRGGIGGDNWNLDHIRVRHRSEAGETKLFEDRGEPLFRFTGDNRSRELAF